MQGNHRNKYNTILIKINTILDRQNQRRAQESVKHSEQNLPQNLIPAALQGPENGHSNKFIVKGVEYQSLKLKV